MKKTLFLIILAFIMVMTIPAPVNANSKYTVQINSQKVSFDESTGSPLILNDRLLVPIRVLAESVGADVRWNPTTETVKLVMKNSKTISFTMGKEVYFEDDSLKTMDTKPLLRDGRIYLPLRYFSEAVGANLSVSEKDRLISLETDTLDGKLKLKTIEIKDTSSGGTVTDKFPIGGLKSAFTHMQIEYDKAEKNEKALIKLRVLDSDRKEVKVIENYSDIEKDTQSKKIVVEIPITDIGNAGKYIIEVSNGGVILGYSSIQIIKEQDSKSYSDADKEFVKAMTVGDLNFYSAKGNSYNDYTGRVYGKVFLDDKSLALIGTEVTIKHPAATKEYMVPVSVAYYYEGKTFYEKKDTMIVYQGNTQSQYHFGVYHPRTVANQLYPDRSYSVGDYKFKMYVDGKLFCEDTFSVVRP